MTLPAGGREARAENLRGIAAMTASSLFFALNDACLKLVSKADLPRPEPRGPGPADGKDHQHPRK